MLYKVIYTLLLSMFCTQGLLAKELNIAVLGDRSDNKVAALCSLLEVKLSQKNKFVVLDRSHIDKVLEEHQLSALINDPEKRIAIGRLLRVDILVVFETINKKNYLSILEGKLGLRLGHHLLQDDIDKAIDFSEATLESSIKKLNSSTKKLLVIPPLEATGISYKFDKYCQLYADALEEQLVNHPGFIIVEYKNVHLIIKELALHGADGLDKRSLPYYLKGTFKNLGESDNPDMNISLSLHYSSKVLQNSKKKKVALKSVTPTLNQLAGDILDTIIKADDPIIDREADFNEFIKTANEAFKADNRIAGVRLLEAALALKVNDAKLRARLIDEIKRTVGKEFSANYLHKTFPKFSNVKYLYEIYLQHHRHMLLQTDLEVLKEIKKSFSTFVPRITKYSRYGDDFEKRFVPFSKAFNIEVRKTRYAFFDRLLKTKKHVRLWWQASAELRSLFILPQDHIYESKEIYQQFMLAIKYAGKLGFSDRIWDKIIDSFWIDYVHDNNRRVKKEHRDFSYQLLDDLEKLNKELKNKGIETVVKSARNRLLDGDYERMVKVQAAIVKDARKTLGNNHNLIYHINKDLMHMKIWKKYVDEQAGRIPKEVIPVTKKEDYEVSIKKMGLKWPPKVINILTGHEGKMKELESKLAALKHPYEAKAFDGNFLWMWNRQKQSFVARDLKTNTDIEHIIAKELPQSTNIDICPVSQTHFLIYGSVAKDRKWLARIKLIKGEIDFKIVLEARTLDKGSKLKYDDFERNKNLNLVFYYGGMKLLIDPKNNQNRRVLITRTVGVTHPLIYNPADESLTLLNEELTYHNIAKDGRIYYFSRIYAPGRKYQGLWFCSLGFPDFKLKKEAKFADFNLKNFTNRADSRYPLTLWNNKVLFMAMQKHRRGKLWVVDLATMKLKKHEIFDEDRDKANIYLSYTYVDHPAYGLIAKDPHYKTYKVTVSGELKKKPTSDAGTNEKK